jgi:hypothetical protein
MVCTVAGPRRPDPRQGRWGVAVWTGLFRHSQTERKLVGRGAHDLGELLLGIELVLAVQHVFRDVAVGDLAQGDHGRLVGLFLHQGLLAAGGDLPGALAGEHDQFKTVVDAFEAVFYGYACHGCDPEISSTNGVCTGPDLRRRQSPPL